MYRTASLLCFILLSFCQPLAAQDDYSNGTALLGIRIRPVPLNVLVTVGLNPGQGTMVTRVWPGTAADRMGLQPGDVIVNVNGTDINSRKDVRTTVIDHNAGDDAEIIILRNSSEPQTLHGTFSEMPDWLEERFVPRVPHMTERWENIVADRQREILTERQAAVDALETQVAALEQHRAQAKNAASLPEPLPAIEFNHTSNFLQKPAQGSVIKPWHFLYAWTYSSNRTGASACDVSSSLVHF